MEEKKLTDEETIKALDICYNSPCCSADCPYFNKNGRNFCVENKAFYGDLKRILQEHAEQKAEIEKLLCKNAELEVRCEGILKDYYAECQTCDEQRVENERVKEKFSISHYRDSWKNKFFKANEEIELLTEELKKCGQELIDSNREQEELQNRNAELQKLVEAWKARAADLKHYKELVISEKESAFWDGVNEGKNKAVKDTAKEILNEVVYEYTENIGYTDWLENCYFGGAMERLCEKYGLKAIQTKKGVEVE